MDYIEQLNVMLKAENFASSVTLLPISPWGHFTTALNGAVQNAVDNGFDIIAFQVGFLNSFLQNTALSKTEICVIDISTYALIIYSLWSFVLAQSR